VTLTPLPPQQGIITGVSLADVARVTFQAARTRWTGSSRARARDAAQDRFETEARRLAADLARTKDLTRWHGAMRDLILRHLLLQATIGKGRALNLADLPRINLALARQTAYLQRWAQELAQGLPSEAVLTNRAASYSGAGRALWHELEAAGAPVGMVSYYRSRDDRGTCSPCLAAERRSPYLPEQCPMPGSVCLGRGSCRCGVEHRYEPQTAQRLRRER
jgi:hypothetical protein